MRFDVVTLFPELFAPFLAAGVTRRAYETKQVDVRLWQLRDYAQGNYRRVDDRPFGGGPGMVMLADPLARCLAAVQADRGDAAPVLLFSPIGERLDHDSVERWSASAGAILLCGRYEGVDERVIEARGLQEVSIGDYVLSGGEPAALVLLDACVRLLPGVMGAAESGVEESFSHGLLEYPHYTRPAEWQGRAVPPVLLSGHHAEVARWRQAEAERITRERRPDLWAQYTSHAAAPGAMDGRPAAA
jgi:tRNA (guanine37-N1)-methyltransferase